MTSLKRLRIFVQGLNKETQLALAKALPSSLEKLVLRFNEIDLETIRALPSSLKNLGLRLDSLDVEEIRNLFKVIPVSLTTMNLLFDSNFGREYVRALAKVIPPFFKRLSVSSNHIEPEDINELKKEFADINIVLRLPWQEKK